MNFEEKKSRVLKFPAFFRTLKAEKLGGTFKKVIKIQNVISFFVVFLKKKDIICPIEFISREFAFPFWRSRQTFYHALNFSNL